MNVLFLSHRLPYAPNRGDRIRAHYILREMSRWANVDLCALAHDADEVSHANDLRDMTRSVTVARVPRTRNLIRAPAALASSIPLTHLLLDTPQMIAAVDKLAGARRPDVVFCFCTGVGPLALRQSLSGVPLILDMVDVDSFKWSAMARSMRWPMKWVYSREAVTLAKFEQEITRRSFATLVTTEREKDDLLSLTPGSDVRIVQNGVDLDRNRPRGKPVDSSSVVFVGVLDYPPNVEGVLWLCREVWPGVLRQRPDATLSIVGARPSRAVRQLGELPGVTVHADVPDVRPYLWQAAVAVAPLLTARGIQNKVIEAIAAGLPVVTTPVVSQGLPHEVRKVCLIAGDATTFAGAVMELLGKSAAERGALVDTLDVSQMSWNSRLSELSTIVRGAAQTRTSQAITE